MGGVKILNLGRGKKKKIHTATGAVRLFSNGTKRPKETYGRLGTGIFGFLKSVLFESEIHGLSYLISLFNDQFYILVNFNVVKFFLNCIFYSRRVKTVS